MDRQRPALRPMDGQNRNYALRLAGLQRFASSGTAVEEPSPQHVELLAEPHADLICDTLAPIPLPLPLPAAAGSASSVAESANPLRIDSVTATAAGLDPEFRFLFEEAVATLQSLKAGRE